nr:SLC13 family permease [Microlunatus panaciterrae]
MLLNAALSEYAGRVGVIVPFLLFITVVAELADRIGVFDVIAHRAARLARGSVLALWLLVVLIATLATIVLSLDTTAVLLTPVVLAVAAQLGLDRAVFAYTAVWLANTASLLLPVSNLTNLLAWQRLQLHSAAFAGLMWPAALAVLLVTIGTLALLFRGPLQGRYLLGDQPQPDDRILLVSAIVICALLGPAFVLTGHVVLSAGLGALAMVALCLIRQRALLGWYLVPWKLMLGVAVLFAIVQVAHQYGLGALLSAASGSGEGPIALLRLVAVSALGANLVNNLPAYLALEPVIDGSLQRASVLLVGVGVGPLLTPWASLATLLWAGRCRAAGVSVDWRRFALRGAVLVPVALVAGTAAQILVHH